jgi:peptide-methionine (S)-S-oxide reductase
MECAGSRRPAMYAMLISAMYFQMGLHRAGCGFVSMPSRCGRLRVDPSEIDNFRGKRQARDERRMPVSRTETAILAGGCFWGMQDLIRKLPGVHSTRVGYSGGDVPNATYRNHGTHAEALEVVFDPDTLAFRSLLETFFQIHDPTTVDRQGNDRGTSYRSGIYYTSEAQRMVAEETIADVNASGLWPGKVVTEVRPAGPFWQAEPEHQDYLERYPNGYSCHYARPNWKLPRRA